MNELFIRDYKIEDHDEVQKLHEVALKATGAYVSTGNWNDDFKDIEGIYLKTGGEFVVGIVDCKIVAMGAFRKISEDVAEIKRMRVHPDFQRQGFGQKIYNELENRAKTKGFTKLVLDTTPIQAAALKFYAKNGFKETHRTNNSGIEMIYFEKRLALAENQPPIPDRSENSSYEMH